MFDPPVRDVVELVPVAVDGVHVDLPEAGLVHGPGTVQTRGSSLRILGSGQLVLHVAVGDQDCHRRFGEWDTSSCQLSEIGENIVRESEYVIDVCRSTTYSL